MAGPTIATTDDGRRVPVTSDRLSDSLQQLQADMAALHARLTRQFHTAAELRQLVKLLDHDLLECAQLVGDAFDDCQGLHSNTLAALKTILSRARARIQTQRETGDA